MLLTEGLLGNIILHLKVLKICGPFPFVFDKKTTGINFSSYKSILATQLTTSLLLAIAILLCGQLWLLRKKVSIVVSFEGMIYAASNIIFVIGSFMFLKRKDQVIELFSLIVQFERTQLNSSLGKLSMFCSRKKLMLFENNPKITFLNV